MTFVKIWGQGTLFILRPFNPSLVITRRNGALGIGCLAWGTSAHDPFRDFNRQPPTVTSPILFL